MLGRCINKEQAEKLCLLFDYISVHASVDQVIELLRDRFDIQIYNTAPPYVSPISNKVEYGFSVKKCNPQWGWNHRVSIGKTKWYTDIWEAKGAALNMALDWILDQERSRANKLSK